MVGCKDNGELIALEFSAHILSNINLYWLGGVNWGY